MVVIELGRPSQGIFSTKAVIPIVLSSGGIFVTHPDKMLKSKKQIIVICTPVEMLNLPRF
jgi:hypothetical protein